MTMASPTSTSRSSDVHRSFVKHPIRSQSLRPHRVLGRGAFGAVCLGSTPAGLHAVKLSAPRLSACREPALHARCGAHANILGLRAAFGRRGRIALVLTLAPAARSRAAEATLIAPGQCRRAGAAGR
jgi:hypothetical protein